METVTEASDNLDALDPETAASTVDWNAAARVADRLGLRPRELVDEQDADAVCDWALRMASQCNTSRFMEPRVASYFELATLVGHREPIPTQSQLDWLEKSLSGIEKQLGRVHDVLAAIAAESATNGESDERADDDEGSAAA